MHKEKEREGERERERERQRDRLTDLLMACTVNWHGYGQSATCVVDHVPKGFRPWFFHIVLLLYPTKNTTLTLITGLIIPFVWLKIRHVYNHKPI